MIKIKERKCNKIEDKEFIYETTKETLYPYISKFLNPTRERFEANYENFWKDVVILLHNNKKIGFYQLKIEGNTLEIVKIFFIPQYQKKGLGTLFIKKFEAMGYKKLRLEVWENNPAVNFYKKLGFVAIQNIEHKIHMEKTLR